MSTMRLHLKRVIVGLFLVSLSLALTVCGDTGSVPLPVGKGSDLHTDIKIAWESGFEPLVATTDKGVIFVIWNGKGVDKPAQDAGIPFIPNEYTSSGKQSGFESVPGLSIYDGKNWSMPQLLVSGVRECHPKFAWSTGENLNLVVDPGDGRSLIHMQYQTSKKEWTRLHDLNVSPESYLLVGKTVHAAEATDNSIRYVSFDGEVWSKPVVVEGVKSTWTPHLAVTGDGVVHILWRAASGGEFGHITVMPDGSARKSTVDFPILRDEFDVTTDPRGNLIMAYREDVKEGSPDADAVRVRILTDGNWSKPSLVGKASGLMLGNVRTVSVNHQVFLTWCHRAEYGSGAIHVSGPVRSFVVLDEKGSWSDPKPVAVISDLVFGNKFMGEAFPGIHGDQFGRVHVTWSSGPMNYHAIAAELPAGPPTGSK